MSRLLNLVTRMEEADIKIIAINDDNKVVFCETDNKVTPYVIWSYDDSGDWYRGIYAREYNEGKNIFLSEAFYI